MAQLVRTIRFDQFGEEDNDGVISITQDTWLSPDFFLTMRKGDVKVSCSRHTSLIYARTIVNA